MNIISGILGVAFIVLWGWAGFLCAKRKGRDTGYWAIACVFIPVILFVIELSSPPGNTLFACAFAAGIFSEMQDNMAKNIAASQPNLGQ